MESMNFKKSKVAKISILLFFGIFLFSVGYVSADMPDWHVPTPCVGCHRETIGAYTGPGECGNCHNNYVIEEYNNYSINIQRLQSEHNPKICKACHIGNTMVDATPKQIFHNGHEAIECVRCHTQDNFTIIKVQNKNFECVSCHGDQIHGIHAKNLGRACPICHGSWAEGKVYKREYKQADQTVSNKELEKFTIWGFIKKIFSVFGM